MVQAWAITRLAEAGEPAKHSLLMSSFYVERLWQKNNAADRRHRKRAAQPQRLHLTEISPHMAND